MTRFESPWVRGMICCGWLCMLVGGLLCYRSFMGELTTGVEPPSGSDSQIAKEMLSKYFKEPAVMLTVLVRSGDGVALIKPGYLNGSVDFSQASTKLTNATNATSQALRTMSLQLKNTGCNASFLSFWDVRDLVPSETFAQQFRDAQKTALFPANGASTMMITQVSDCGGRHVDASCVNKQDYCKPVKDYSESLKTFASNHNGKHGLQVMVTSFPDIETAVLNGEHPATLFSRRSTAVSLPPSPHASRRRTDPPLAFQASTRPSMRLQ